MPVTQLLSLLRRVTPGAWTAVIWCAATLDSVRMSLGLPFMPHIPGGLKPSAWLSLAAATAVAMTGSALLRRRPLASLGLLLTGSVIAALAISSPTIALGQYLAADLALGVIVANRSRPAWIAALAMTLGVLGVYAEIRIHLGSSFEHSPGWQVYVLTAVVAWLVGNTARLASYYADRLRTQAAAEAVTAERLRISRELHDMVAHSLGIIALQAGAAARVIDTQPQHARDALGEVEAASRETLAGLRRMLGSINRSGGPGSEPPLEPAPGLADVERLAAATTSAGVHVDVQWRGTRRPLPPDIELTAFRIIQESVTNVIRHAGTDSCQVLIDQRDEELSIEVSDNGHGRAPTDGGGRGLAGMRERVALLRGEFTAGPGPGGGFRVVACLPVPAKAAAR